MWGGEACAYPGGLALRLTPALLVGGCAVLGFLQRQTQPNQDKVWAFMATQSLHSQEACILQMRLPCAKAGSAGEEKEAKMQGQQHG